MTEVDPYKILFEQDIKSASGIPSVTFISNVEEFLKDKVIDDIFNKLQEAHQKYKYYESKLTNNVSILTVRSKQLQESLDIVERVEKKKDDTYNVQYELSEGVYSSAEVKEPKSIYLWLGANVMLEYSFEEAGQVLRKNKESVDRQLRETIQDLGFVKDQITTTDVNISRVYNYDIIQKRKQKQNKSEEEEEDK